ncbi:beta-ketoacyl-ACP synthase III [Corallococcus terminator]|uniref:Beta-ketoacyl-[acyl-carrier-protein] synthase III n=1 Tax=Corallococcus terminator TaxID=2316733 RepID=A0A3A8J4M9_9BACT|nr:beta-ketoacyl-ACP synthase III [Corallococcus terminator]RKG90632.1 ketoacyl-ACP synthase III [Corallococcus terminator]
MSRTQILGTGSYAPARVLTNQDLEQLVDTSDTWIRERTGIQERRQAAPDEATSDLAVQASLHALQMAGVAPEDLDLIVVGTVTPDMPMPSCAALVQAKLGARRAFAFDVSAACAGALYALSVADQFVRTGQVKRALVVGAELLTRAVDWSDRNTCVLFGDGAGAMVLGPGPASDDSPETMAPRGILSTCLRTEGSMADLLCIPAGGSRTPVTADNVDANLHKLKMNGKEVFRFAVRALVESTQASLGAHGMHPGQVDHVIAHQANLRILEAVLQRLEIPREKCWLNLHKYGNTSSASLPMSLDEAQRAGRLKRGDVIAMMAIGAGMAWGSAVVRW